MKKVDVICIGAAIVDIPLYPVGEFIFEHVSYPLDDISMKIGGDAINEATIITRLGHKVSLMSVVGSDGAGMFIREFAEKNGILTDNLKVDEKMTTSLNIGMVREDGERTFITNRNGSLWKMGLDSISLKEIKDAKILSLASIFNNPLLNNDALVSIFQKAKEENMLICADMVKSRLGETLEDIKEALSYVDYFFPNYEEAADLTGKEDLKEIADIFLALGVKNVLIKIGKQGCFIKNADVEKIVPAFKKDSSVKIDTIGAGDNFVSGFISELLNGKGFEECAYFGNATAAVSIESLGATTGVKSRRQVEEMINNYK
ncbi:carbohydrate kinase family protein [Enterococcus sp. AZ196]|uniref:carbohydrate kinase family protein n=1 Tax=Enterococcus sp. AZ196 TaxID=2774659 RepID=UPI003D28EC51